MFCLKTYALPRLGKMCGSCLLPFKTLLGRGRTEISDLSLSCRGNNSTETRPSCKALLIFSPLFSSSFFLIEFSTHHFTCCCCWIFVFQPAFVSPQFPFFFFQLFRSSISHLSCHLHFLKPFLGTVALNLIWVFLISSVYVL